MSMDNEMHGLRVVVGGVVVFLCFLFVLLGNAHAWDDTSYTNRIPIYGTENSGLANTNVTLNVNLSLSAGFDASTVLPGCKDLVVYDAVTSQQRAFTNESVNGRPCYENITFACSFTAGEANKLCAYVYYNKPTADSPTTKNSLTITKLNGAAGTAGWFVQYGTAESGVRESNIVGTPGNPKTPMLANSSGTGFYAPTDFSVDGWSIYNGGEAAATVFNASVQGLYSTRFNLHAGTFAVTNNITYYDTGKAIANITLFGTAAADYRPMHVGCKTGPVGQYKFAKVGGTYSFTTCVGTIDKVVTGLNYYGFYNATTSEYIAFIVLSNNTKVGIWGYTERMMLTQDGLANPSLQLLIIHGVNRTASLQTTMEEEYIKAHYPPTVTIGAAEETNLADISIEAPANTTYYTSTNLLNFTRSAYSSWGETTTPCWLTQTGTNWRALGNVTITYTETLTNQSGKGNFVNVSCWDSKVLLNRTKTVGWYNWHGFNLSVFSANGTAVSSWNFMATNNTITTVSGKSNPYLAEYTAIGRAYSTTFKFYDSKDIYANTTFVYNINDVMGFVNKSVKLYRNQEWRASSSATSAAIDTFTITFANSTMSVSNSTSVGRVRVGIDSIPTGTVTMTLTSMGYNSTAVTRTINTSSDWNESITMNNAALNITAWDESVQNRFLTFEAYFDNGTATMTKENNTGELYLLANETLMGDVKITISNSSYIARSYYITMTESTASSIRAFLLSNTNPTNVYPRIMVQTISEAAITNAPVSIQRFIGGVWITVAQLRTDSSGVAAFYLDSTVSYKVKIEASGYISREETLNPLTETFRYKMSSSAYDTWKNVLTNTTMWFTPGSGWFNSTTLPVSCFISSPSSALVYWGLNISWNGTDQYFEQKTDANGGLIQFSLITYNLTGEPIQATCFFKRAGYDVLNLTRTWTIFNMTGYNYTATTIGLDLGDESPIGKTVLILILSMALASVFAGMGVFVCALVFLVAVGVLIALFGPVLGIMTWLTYTGIVLFMIALMVRGGI